MRTKKNNDPVVTASILDKILDKRLKRFVTRDEFNKAIKALHGRCDGLGIQIFDLRQDMVHGFERIDSRFDQIMGHIDAFMKRTEANETEIKLLGKQHDDLARYCTNKIGYPIYGRNL